MEPINIYVVLTTTAGDLTLRPTQIALTENGWVLVATDVSTGEQVGIDLSLLTAWRVATDEEILAADEARAEYVAAQQAPAEDLTPDE